MCIFGDCSANVSVCSREAGGFPLQQIDNLQISWLLYWHGLQKAKKIFKNHQNQLLLLWSVLWEWLVVTWGKKKINQKWVSKPWCLRWHKKDLLLSCCDHLWLGAWVSTGRMYEQQDAHSSCYVRLHFLPSRQVKHRLPAVWHFLHEQRIGSPSNCFYSDFYEPLVRPKIWIRVAFLGAKGLTWDMWDVCWMCSWGLTAKWISRSQSKHKNCH